MNAAQRWLCAALCAASFSPSAALAATYTARLRFAPAASADLAGYFVRVRSAVTNTATNTDVGLPAPGADGMVSVAIPGLDVRTTHFFTVSSYAADGTESPPSNELSTSYAIVAPRVDSDGDGLSDAMEDANLDQRVGPWETDPERVDSDGDGVRDAQDQCGATAAGTPVDAAGCPKAYTLLVSRLPNRTRPISLDGSMLDGNAYVFVRPESGVREISFWLDDPAMHPPARQRETKAPYDFRGGTTTAAVPFDTRTVADGAHTITAAVTLTSGTVRVLNAGLTVGNAACGLGGCTRSIPDDACDEPGNGGKQLVWAGRRLRANAVLTAMPAMDPTVAGVSVLLRGPADERLYQGDVLAEAFAADRNRHTFRLTRGGGRAIGVRRLVLRRRGEQMVVRLVADAPGLADVIGPELVTWGVRIGTACMRIVPMRCVRGGGESVRCR
jgi:hypothetical protein